MISTVTGFDTYLRLYTSRWRADLSRERRFNISNRGKRYKTLKSRSLDITGSINAALEVTQVSSTIEIQFKKKKKRKLLLRHKLC